MILYLDTSALVKLYVAEPGSEEVREMVRAAQIVATSRVAYLEARAGIAKKFRAGELSESARRQIVEELKSDWERYFIVEVSQSVIELGGELVDKHPLRGFDALHLASALLLKARISSPVNFSCFDERLKEVAQAEGLSVS